MKNLLLIALLPVLLAADRAALRGQLPLNRRPEIVRNHGPMIHFAALAKEKGWEVQRDSNGHGDGLYKHIDTQFRLVGEFTEDDNPISSYFDHIAGEFSRLGVIIGGGSTHYNEDEGFFQKRVSYKYGGTAGMVRATAALDYKKRFLIDIIIIEFPIE